MSIPRSCSASGSPPRASGPAAGRPERLRQRVETYFDPLPFYYEPLENAVTDTQRYPLNALTQRPMAMYHSWDSQNAWLRQIHSHNYLFLSPRVGPANGFGDGDWIWVESAHGKVRCMCRFSEAVEPGTVWTWNAIGKAAGAWGLGARADESRKGFLLNHLISEELPPSDGGRALLQRRPGDRPGGLVRRAGAGLQGRRRRAQDHLAPVRPHAARCPGRSGGAAGGRPMWRASSGNVTLVHRSVHRSRNRTRPPGSAMTDLC